jgi:hypothetical protein
MKFSYLSPLVKKAGNFLNMINKTRVEGSGLLKLMLEADATEKASYEQIMQKLNS